MMTIPNALSLLRFPLAFLFLSESIPVRLLAIVLAMASDGLDGFIARRFGQASKLGRILDPATDKFFVIFLLTVLIQENRIRPWELATFFSRDAAVLLFGLYLIATHKLKDYSFKPFWCGKITTTLQFFVLLGLTLNYSIPPSLYFLFLILGICSVIELFIFNSK